MEDFRRKFWIRRDREQWFWIGVVAACAVSCFVTTWWQFSDKVAVKRRFVLRKAPAITKLKEAEILREDRLSPGGSKLLDIGRMLEAENAPPVAAPGKKGAALIPAGEKPKYK